MSSLVSSRYWPMRRDDRVLVLQQLEHLAVGAPAGLALAEGGQAEPLEEHLAELLGRVDHELAAGQLPDLVAQLVGAVAHPARRSRRGGGRRGARRRASIAGQHPRHRQLDVAVERLRAPRAAGASALARRPARGPGPRRVPRRAPRPPTPDARGLGRDLVERVAARGAAPAGRRRSSCRAPGAAASPVARTTDLASWHATASPASARGQGRRRRRRPRAGGDLVAARRRPPSPPRRRPGPTRSTPARRMREVLGRRLRRRDARRCRGRRRRAGRRRRRRRARRRRRSRLPNSKRSKQLAQRGHPLGAEVERRDVVEVELDRRVGVDDAPASRVLRAVVGVGSVSASRRLGRLLGGVGQDLVEARRTSARSWEAPFSPMPGHARAGCRWGRPPCRGSRSSAPGRCRSARRTASGV